MVQTLDLDTGRMTTGKAGAVLAVRALSDNDVFLLAEPKGLTTAPLKQLRESHHQLARLLASGLKQVEVSAVTGYSQSRISILKGDPAFNELLAHYREQQDSMSADISGMLSSLSADVISELRDRMEDDPTSFSNPQLMNFMTTLLDRTGHGPTAKIQTTNINISGEALAKIKQLVKDTQNGTTTTNNLIHTSTANLPRSGETNLGGEIQDRPEHQEPSNEGQPCGGNGVSAEVLPFPEKLGEGK